jgi:hypothetical protein
LREHLEDDMWVIKNEYDLYWCEGTEAWESDQRIATRFDEKPLLLPGERAVRLKPRAGKPTKKWVIELGCRGDHIFRLFLTYGGEWRESQFADEFDSFDAAMHDLESWSKDGLAGIDDAFVTEAP